MSTDTSTFRLTTRTPIWTGGIDGKADRLHMPGFIGNLRSWYELIVRGTGGSVCDPNEHTCQYDSAKARYGLCDACYVFGATGWARRFRIIINDETHLRLDDSYKLVLTASRSHGNKITPRWPLKSHPLSGQVEIKITANDQNRQFPTEVIKELIQLLADWATVGAKPQLGFGVVDISPRLETHCLATYLRENITPPPAKDANEKKFPSLQNMFFASISADKLPTNEALNLKYDLRSLFRENTDLRHYIMGTINKHRQASKIMVSHPYANNTMRIWGWIPETVSKFKVSRTQVIEQVYSYLDQHYTINYWREFNSPRDKYQYNDALQFLESLLKGEK